MILSKQIVKISLVILLVASVVIPVLGVNTATADVSAPIIDIEPVLVESIWTQTSPADFQAGTLVQTEATTSPGDVKLIKTSTDGDFIYSFYGNSAYFARYDITENSWFLLTASPDNTLNGASLTYDGGDYIYAFRGGNTNSFWCYSISGQSWTKLTGPSEAISNGGSMVYSNGFIYAFSGGNTNSFWRYSTFGQSWIPLANMPDKVGTESALVYVNSSYLYAISGNPSAIWQYNISTDKMDWQGIFAESGWRRCNYVL
jgi:hypothetical protein